jgi:hypothetical protein
VFSCEPGGAEVLIPAVRLLRQTGRFDVDVATYGHGVTRFTAKHVDCREAGPIAEGDLRLLDQCAPDLVLTSATSLPFVDMSERHLWRQARRRGIPSLAFLDQWQNYATRFSGTDAEDRLAYLPDWINCLNAIGRSEMVEEGFDEARLFPLGHPYLSSLAADARSADVRAAKARIGVPAGAEIALFVSEPIREYFADRYGYDQYVVLDYFLSSLSAGSRRPHVVLKLHPKDDRASYDTLIRRFPDLPMHVVSSELSPLEAVAISDWVFGMTSIMLIEGYVLGRTVVSLQPGLRVDDPMVLSRHNLIPVVRDAQPRNLFGLECSPRGAFDVEFNSDAFLELVDAC